MIHPSPAPNPLTTLAQEAGKLAAVLWQPGLDFTPDNPSLMSALSSLQAAATTAFSGPLPQPVYYAEAVPATPTEQRHHLCREIDSLVVLLRDPQPGLRTWAEFLARRLRTIQAITCIALPLTSPQPELI